MKQLINLLLFFIMLLASSHICAQQSKNDNLSINISYQKYPQKYLSKQLHVFSIDSYYNINKHVETGAFIGVGKSFYESSIKQNDLLYGISAKVKTLPFFIDTDNLRLSIYLTEKIGGNYSTVDLYSYKEKNNKFIWSSYVGVEYFFSKHIGALFELGFEHIHENRFNSRYGFSYKF
ncbi:MAG: hypothetical protein JEZ09_17270 [Salinivirgaceae bacterium]|nr:hypothetical protein [Salinivirgaceae bacterium]